MTPERYSQVKKLFQQVVDQPPQEWAAFLERACGPDRELFSQVRELLKADYTSNTFLETPAVPPVSKILAEVRADTRDGMPSRVGPYAIQKLLGSGGMGAVYLASRSDESFHKQVAIKVLHRGLDTAGIQERFRRERQIIASLDHPNIARLLDGGATSDGRPYIVMEYVDGLPITTWCDQNRLNTRRRLAIFLQVCDALHYAHQNLIIHRDIKPGNILVRADNTVKLLDFGIAKLMNPDAGSPVPERTATSLRLMTPHYASPEQVRGEPVTTASDVYLLGIVLYELLTGHRPYEGSEGITQDEPRNASEAIFRNGAGPLANATAVSTQRESSAALLVKALQGDIDAILRKALRREVAGRYQSVAQFAEDIRNHLQQLPVSAQPYRPMYRMGLFFRRNRRLTAAAVGGIALLIGITVFAVWQAVAARQARQRAEAQFTAVRKMSKVILFDVQDSLAPLAGTTAARRLLLQSASAYLGSLDRDPALERALRWEVASGYLRLGHLQGNPNFPNVGDTAGAMESYQRARQLWETILREEPGNTQAAIDLAAASEALGDLMMVKGDPASAVHALRRAVALREAAKAPAETMAASYHNLAVALAAAGKAEEAMALSRRAHQTGEALSGPAAPRLQAWSHSQVAAVLERTGDQAGAVRSYRTALELFQQLASAEPLAATPKRELSFALGNLAGVDAPNAVALYGRSLQLRRELAASDPENLQARRDLCQALARQGDGRMRASQFAGALESYRELLQTARDWVRRDPANAYANHTLAVANMKLAETLRRTGDPDLAMANARAAIGVMGTLRQWDPDNAAFQGTVARVHWLLGRMFLEASNWTQAQTELELALRLFGELARRGALPPEDRAAGAVIEIELGRARQRTGSTGAAVRR